MRGRVLVLGSPEDLELAGLPDSGGGPYELAVVLRDPSLLGGVEARCRVAWLAGGAQPVPDGCPIVAQAGEGLWRRAPWPAADALFELDAPASGSGFLIAGGPAERRERLFDRLAGLGREGLARERLEVADIRGAQVVALLSPEPGGPLPAEAPAVAAAGRVVVADSYEPDFGLQPGIDLLPASGDDDVVQAVDAVLARPEAFAAARALAAHAAHAHRASAVYPRLLADVALLGG